MIKKTRGNNARHGWFLITGMKKDERRSTVS